MNRNRNPEKPIHGCLGRMVNLFDFNTSLNANKLLTETPHYERSPVSRSQSDVSRTRPVADQVFDKMSELPKSSSNRKQNMTPIKMLIAQEMSKEEGPKQSPPNLVAKLMGLDTLPQRKPRSHSRSLDFTHKEDRFMEIKEDNEVKDVFEIWSPQKGRNKELKKDKNMELVREKFMEAKRLSTNENLRQSKQFQEALEVLNSNKDLFLKFLQEPNSLFSQNIHHSQSLPPDSRRITVLKPTKLLDTHKLNKKDDSNLWDKSKTSQPSQPTRIVVLKPNSIKSQEVKIAPSPSSTSNEDEFYGDIEDTKEVTNGGHRRDETLLSSVFSNGYNGDESSFSKSEVYYAGENLSDSEVMSPVSRHSWDYVNRFGGSPFSSSSFTCSPESSVCREAKKRLSERWVMMSLNGNVLEQRHVRRSSSTLGEMLALSDLKKEEQFQNKGENDHCDDGECSPKSIVRSKSCGSRLGEVSETLKVKKDDESKDLVKEKSGKSSLFKGLFFSKSRKSNKKSNKDDEENRSSRNGNEDDIDGSLRKESCQDLAGNLPEVETFGNINENQEQPSPSSVLELQFEDDDNTASCSYSAKLKDHGVDPNKFNLIDKSPPIGSISRSLSFDDPPVGPTKTSTPEEDEHESYLYVQTLLSLPKTNTTNSPLDQSQRDTYMSGLDHILPLRSNQKHQKSTQRLIFDCVNEALLHSVHADHVWARINDWKDTCIWEGDDVAVVRKEVVTRVWVEDLKSEIDEIKREIEDKLVNELVEELILS